MTQTLVNLETSQIFNKVEDGTLIVSSKLDIATGAVVTSLSILGTSDELYTYLTSKMNTMFIQGYNKLVDGGLNEDNGMSLTLSNIIRKLKKKPAVWEKVRSDVSADQWYVQILDHKVLVKPEGIEAVNKFKSPVPGKFMVTFNGIEEDMQLWLRQKLMY